MNDFELNKAIAERVIPKVTQIFELHTGAAEVQTKGDSPIIVDYLKYWEDLMPLVVEYKLSLYPHLTFWRSDPDFESHETKNDIVEGDNPQRALAECLLKVLAKETDK